VRIGIASVAAAIALADDEAAAVAAGLWSVLAARSIASIPYVRYQIQRAHDRAGSPTTSDVAQLAAVAVAAVGWAIGWVPGLGVVAITLLAVFQLVDSRGPLRPITVVGVQQTILGLLIVASTAIGVLTA